MTPDTYLPCPRCGADSPAYLHVRNRGAGTVVYRVWCQAHGTKQVTL